MKIKRKENFLVLLNNCEILLYRLSSSVYLPQRLACRKRSRCTKILAKKMWTFIGHIVNAIRPALLEPSVLIKFIKINLTP